jgi:hypothetical protein
LTGVLVDAGGTQVDGFPNLATRLGTPATGLTDYPEPRPITERSSFESFVEAVLAGRLRELIIADLTARADGAEAVGRVRSVAAGLRGDLNGMSAALEPDWLADLDEELDWLLSALDGAGVNDERVRSVLRRERYLRLLDLLVSAVRGPRVDTDVADLPAAETLAGLLSEAVHKLVKDAAGLESRSQPVDWTTAALSAEEVGRIDSLARIVVAKKDRRAARKLRRVIELLTEATAEAEAADEAQRQARFAAPSEAFELGRAHQRHRQRQAAALEGFFEAWAKVSKSGKVS